MKKEINSISVVMTVKNGEKFLNNAIESILNQSFSHYEFVIIDNNSDDATPKILEDFRKKDSRVKILTNTNNETLYQARMKAIKETKNDWFALMDADDESHPDRLKKQIEFINSAKIDSLAVVSTYGQYINGNSKIVANKFEGPRNIDEFNKIFLDNASFALIDPSTIIKKEFFFKVGGYLENNIAADLDLYYKISEAGYLIQTVSLPLYYYRVHGGSYSVQNTMKQCEVIHFLNYNMRQRRAGKKEITEQEFYINFWNKTLYRIPRKKLDYSKTYYKISAYTLIENKLFSFLLNLIIAFLFSPKYVLKRIYKHLLKRI